MPSSWVLEVLVIISGLLLAILLANHDGTGQQTSLFSKYTLGIVMGLATVFEFIKIPLAEAWVSMTGKRVKLICLLLLCTVTAVTYETMFTGLSVMLDQRKTSINTQEKLIAQKKIDVTTKIKDSNLLSFKAPASNANLIAIIHDEIVVKEKEREKLAEQTNDIIKTNNLFKKQSTKQAISDIQKRNTGPRCSRAADQGPSIDKKLRHSTYNLL